MGAGAKKGKGFPPKWRRASHAQKVPLDPVYGGLDGGVLGAGGLSESSGSALEGVEVSQIIEAESGAPKGRMMLPLTVL